jgi:hypothetical protein
MSREAPPNTDRRAWFRLYPTDIQAIEIEQLTDSQFRCFIRFLCYESQHGSIPNSPSLLAQIAQKRPENWKKIQDKVLYFWRISDENSARLISPLLERDAAEYAATCEKRRASARRGGAATKRRWAEKKSQMQANWPSDAEGHLAGVRVPNRSISSKEEIHRGASLESAPLVEKQKKPATPWLRDQIEAAKP